MDLCERLVRRPGAWVSRRWWEQEGLNLSGKRERAAVAAEGEAGRIGEDAVREDTMGRI